MCMNASCSYYHIIGAEKEVKFKQTTISTILSKYWNHNISCIALNY